MATIGAGVGVLGAAIDQSRLGTKSPYDFAYWTTTFVSPGVPSDYVDLGPEQDATALIVWAANQIGIAFPDTFTKAVAACSGYEMPLETALKTRGALIYNSSKFAITLGLNDIVDIINGRYFIYRLKPSQYSQWTTGAKLPGALY